MEGAGNITLIKREKLMISRYCGELKTEKSNLLVKKISYKAEHIFEVPTNHYNILKKCL